MKSQKTLLKVPKNLTPMLLPSLIPLKRRSLLMTSREETFDISEDKTLVQQKTLTMEDFKSHVESKAGETQPVDTPDEVVETNAIIEDNIKSDDTVSEEIFNKGGEIIHLGQEVEIGEQAMEEVVDNNVTQFDEKSGVGAVALTEINTTQDTTMTQETTGELSESADLSQNQLQDDSETQTQSMSLQDTQTQDTQTQSVCTSIEDNQPPVLYFDLPKRPELTESERMMCRMDTMSICSAPNTFDVQQEIEAKQELEIKSSTENKEVKDILQMEDLLELPAPLPVNDLPSSPITVETPNRTTELLNNTLDISPINSRHSSDTDSPIENSSCIKRNLKHEMEQLDKVEKESENIQSSPQQLGNRNRESEGIEIMEELNRNQDLPNTAQDIINILEGTALNENHEICETEVGQEVEKISPEVPQQIEEAQVKTSEAIPDQTSEVMQQIELAEIVENLETLVPAQNQQNEAVTQIDDNLNHVDVIKPPKENHGIQERASKLLHTINVTSPGSYKFFMKKRGNLSISERMSESENIETEPSLEMTNPLILRKDKPIYPKLVECKDNVMIIVKRVTSPMFVNTLMNKLKNKDIKTVGDLAKQSEMEINRFPFKVPGVTEELTKIVLTSLDKQQLIAFIRSNYELEPKDILEQKDFKSAIKHITETISLPSVFEILTESVENSESESVYFDCMIKHSIDKRPLKDLLENRPLNDIKTALSESVSSNVFNREEVIENCLLPLIENPDDISGYLNRISVVQLGDIVIKRLQTTDLKQFLDQLVEAHGGRNVVTSLNNDLFKYVESSNEIIDLFKHCINIQNEQRQSEVMVELFRFISSKLDLSTLLQLHVDLLKRIPNFIHSDTSN
ncbi:hypothetical protein NQ317_011589 [Molorchus minor]|uniref:Uncharacterized protein n=1 Tax=Molorchus minor TaxID=1323400 RepID=A0ABQ9IX48_9CUCU|nr:hypothetical protein NQ317_011589 [Molorchus minor]